MFEELSPVRVHTDSFVCECGSREFSRWLNLPGREMNTYICDECEATYISGVEK